MVIRRGNWVWAFVAFILVLTYSVFWFVHVWQPSKTDVSQFVIDIEMEDIARIDIRSAEQTVTLVRAPQTQRWSVQAANDPRAQDGLLQANKSAIERLVEQMQEIVVQYDVRASDTELELYGLHPQRAVRVQVYSVEGHILADVVVGDTLQTGRGTFLQDARAEAEAHVFAITADRDVFVRDSWISDVYGE